jgi:hypothetical protein
MTGPQPKKLTYLADWQISLGAISGECPFGFLSGLGSAIQVFLFHLKDRDNRLANQLFGVSFPDYTCVTIELGKISLSIWCNGTCTVLNVDGLSFFTDNFATEDYYDRTVITIPGLQARQLIKDSVLKAGADSSKVSLAQSVPARNVAHRMLVFCVE